MPNRIIKDSIHTSDTVNAMSDFQFRLWVSLITYVDDYGRGDARPAVIKGTCFPLRERVALKDIDAALAGLAGIGCVSLYQVGGKPYLCFPHWEEHQQTRSKRSKCPPPPDGMIASDIICNRLIADAPVIQSESNSNPNPKEKPHAHGEYGWVKLTDAQYVKLTEDLGAEETARCIAHVDQSAQSTGNKNHWRDWYLVVRRCSREGWGQKPKERATAARATQSAASPSAEDMARMQKLMETMGRRRAETGAE